MDNLKKRFLDHIGYVCRDSESASEAFDLFRQQFPDLFPVPRDNQSFWEAIEECLS